jgi:hypothetical protein
MDGSQDAQDPSTADSQQPQSWIENDGLLRDEGILFGLAGLEDGLDHKIDSIREYFEEKKAAVRRKNERLDREVSRVDRQRSEARDEIDRLKTRIEDPPVPEIDGARDIERHTLLRYALGFVAAAAICGLNFYLILDLLRPHFEAPTLVTAGVFLAGSFALFQPTSLFFTSDDAQRDGREAPELWKTRLAEFGMPLVASLFTVSWAYPELGLFRSGSFFLYLSMLFLLGGKLFLSTIPVVALILRTLRRDLRVWWIQRRARQKIETIRDDKLPRLDEDEEEIERRRDEITDISEIEARCESAIELFRSEYALARQAVRDGLITASDREDILSTADADIDDRVVQ